MNAVEPQVHAIVFDFSRVILFPKDAAYRESLNGLHRTLTSENPGYPFFEHFQLNDELLGFLKLIKDKPLYIFTSGYVQEATAIQSTLKDVFKAIYSAERLGVNKSEPNAFKKLCHEIGIDPKNVLFIDDSSSNIAAAQHASLQTYQYSDNKSLGSFFRSRQLT